MFLAASCHHLSQHLTKRLLRLHSNHFDLHQTGLTVSSFPAKTSKGYLIPVTRNFTIIILNAGGFVSEWLPSIAGSCFRKCPLGKNPKWVDFPQR